MTKVCAVCGRGEPEVRVYNGLCLDCFISERLTVDIKRRLKIQICPSCGDHTYKGRWRRDYDARKLKEDIRNTLSGIFKVKGGRMEDFDLDREVDIEWLIRRPHSIKAHLAIYIDGYDEVIEYPISVPLTVNIRLCDRCLREKSGNYEALLQVRMIEGDMDREKRRQIYGIIVEMLGKAYREGRDYRVIKTEDYHYGIDVFYLLFPGDEGCAGVEKKDWRHD